MTLREQIARIIDPSSWRVMDSYLSEVRRKYAGDDAAYDPDAFQHQASLTKADAILALLPAPALPDGWDDAALLRLAEAFNENREHDDVGMSRQDTIAAMRSAMIAARPAAPSEWRDIATAPRDGTPVLIVAASPLFSERRVYLASWATPYEAASDEQCFWRAYRGIGNATSTIPPEWATLWQPLPAVSTEEERT